MVAKRLQRFTLGIGIAFALVLLALLGYLGLVYVVASGFGGWTPDAHSTQAERAHAMDARLRTRMARDQVLALFKNDTYVNSEDGMLDSLADNSDRVYSDEADLYINEPRRYFWNSYDAAWIVRAGFDSNGHLIHHRIDVEQTNGP